VAGAGDPDERAVGQHPVVLTRDARREVLASAAQDQRQRPEAPQAGTGVEAATFAGRQLKRVVADAVAADEIGEAPVAEQPWATAGEDRTETPIHLSVAREGVCRYGVRDREGVAGQ